MWHPFPGFCGLALGPAQFVVIGTASYLTKEYESYNLDPKGEKGEFEKFLVKYVRLAEFIIGLATGSIVLLPSLPNERCQHQLDARSRLVNKRRWANVRQQKKAA